jgi:hypothetical protein
MTSTAVVNAEQAPPRGAWGWGAWLLVTLAVLAEAFVALLATLFINWGASTTCSDPATMSNVREGELGLLLAAVVGLLPWAVAMLASARRLRLAVAGFLAISPLVYGMVAGLDPQFWTGGFCF